MKRSIILFFYFVSLSSAHQIDGIEHTFGATNINAIAGNGGLTAGVSRKGEITLLRWPSPSFYDQVKYKTAIVPVGAGYHARDMKYMGARETMGVFAGIYASKGTEYARMLWFREDEYWKSSQKYLSPDDSIVVNEFESRQSSGPYPLKITQEIFVHPERDILLISFSGSGKGGADEVKIIFYENLAPCVEKIPYIPTSDWADDLKNDFAGVYDEKNDAIIRFNYRSSSLLKLLDYVVASPFPTQGEVDDLLENIDSISGGNGVFIAIGFLEGNDDFQIGFDADGGCPKDRYDPYLEEGFKYIPLSAYVDAHDGDLKGEIFGHCQVNSAISKTIQNDSYWRFSVALAFGSTYSEAIENLRKAREEGFDNLYSKTQTFWRDWLSRARLPEINDERIIAFSKRALITIKNSTDRNTGAIVASVSSQPPYSLDWPRDGAFINAALDVAGYRDMVTEHNLFYSRVQRKSHQAVILGEDPSDLIGTFEMNYYADGVPGGPTFFEIDNTGLAVWSLWTHAKFLEGRERSEYLNQIYPSLLLSGEALLRCKDKNTGLQCWAFEDDALYPTRALQGAVTVYGALKSIWEAGKYLGDDSSFIESIKIRSEELREAIRKWLYNPDEGEFSFSEDLQEMDSKEHPWNLGNRFNRGAQAWLIWPFRIFEGEEEEENQAQKLLDYLKMHLVERKTEGFAYLGKILLALAIHYRNNPQKFEEVKELAEIHLKEVPAPDTYHMGEVVVVLDTDGDGKGDVFENRTAIPHVWAQSLNYLLAMAVYSPSSLENFERTLVKSPSCSCSEGQEAGLGDAIFSILFIFLLLLFRYFLNISFQGRKIFR